ncbi:MAG TPA: tRNA (adenosine(37)-N6)-threonylcarbamoyltransferase complex transferase subunit TsaD [Cyclobacteriaceae bacterium]|nr:tRNA (adenosine(37)-N6)-threonylcarbamoyltransferase complex transferase subunit TsaD [Cyclobacteriaceae bacterium]
MHPKILAIESSCDETSASVISNGKVLNNVIASQSVHHKYGGVVPGLASRAHQKNIVHIVNEALVSSGIGREELDAIAFTKGPGLLGSLLVGASFAKAMALALNLPVIEVNHLQAHVLSHFIEAPRPRFPFLCLTVSGGHTQIVLVKGPLDLTVIGETQDDAVGEAFDKAAKIMGLPYPGGPMVDRLAQGGNPEAFGFPYTSMPSLDFSFSGIKTAFLYFIREELARDSSFIEKRKNDICASIQKHLVGMLMEKLEKASDELGIKEIAIAGGVSANSGLRQALEGAGKRHGWNTFVPEFQYCTDNAAMVAMVAHYKYLNGAFSDLSVSPLARMPLSTP